jgi:hypothetical protein
MLDNFKFKVKSDFDFILYDFLYTATRSWNEETYLVTWVEYGEECSEIYHELSVEKYVASGVWIIQFEGGNVDAY